MKWHLKVFRHAVLSRFPFRDSLRRFKHRQFGYEPDPANLFGTLKNLEQMVAALAATGRSFAGATVLEIGSGWFPAIPIMLYLSGAKHVLMTDLTPHMDGVTFEATLRFLKNAFPENQRLHAISRLADLPITYFAPFSACTIGYHSIDFVISRTVLEHIPQNDLIRLLGSLHPKLAPDGLMIHVIDNSDHLEHSDKSISMINFLTWPERKHALVNWLMSGGENRLRHHQYPAIFENAGFSVLSESAFVHEPTRQIVRDLPLVPPYSTMSAEQLAALTSIYVLSPKRIIP